ncbi:MAG: protein phosphatase 2C domain-containing protein [Oscillospiraceae bacterium]|nr:protein phosphatase 2C domain-containing protein [Oscillospiraceae bacterium]
MTAMCGEAKGKQELKRGNSFPSFSLTKQNNIRIIKSYVRGASHKRKNTECQDSSLTRQIGDIIFLAAADGHGSESCPYSKSGSRQAVNVFYDLMHKHFLGYKSNPEKLMSFLGREGETSVARAIDLRWKKLIIAEHMAENREIPSINTRLTKEQLIWKQYGTTLLGLVLTPTFYFAFQLGDGDVLLLKGGKAETVNKSERILGTATHSLSREDSWKRALTCVNPIPDVRDDMAFMISTDGFSNSYASDSDFLRTCLEYHAVIKQYGTLTVRSNLKKWLNETSEKGSGDDITVLFAVYG